MNVAEFIDAISDRNGPNQDKAVIVMMNMRPADFRELLFEIMTPRITHSIKITGIDEQNVTLSFSDKSGFKDLMHFLLKATDEYIQK